MLCPGTSLDMDTLFYLSRIPALTRLQFALRNTLPDRNARSDSPQLQGLTLPRTFSINILDSSIEQESVLAIATFFASIMSYSNFLFWAWETM